MKTHVRRGQRTLAVVLTCALAANVAAMGVFVSRASRLFVGWPGTVVHEEFFRDAGLALVISIGGYELLTYLATRLSPAKTIDAIHVASARQAQVLLLTSVLAAALWTAAVAGSTLRRPTDILAAVLFSSVSGLVLGIPSALAVWWLAHRRNVKFIRHGHRHDEHQSVPPVVR